MEIFSTLFFKITTAYLYILLGFVAGKYLKADRVTIANILFYFMSPIMFFSAVSRVKLDLNIIAVPIITYSIACFCCFIFYYFSKIFWKDSTRNIIAFSSGNANTGFFGLPIAFELFDEPTMQIYIFGMLGIALYENSYGFYIISKGKYRTSEIIPKILKLPIIQAFTLGLLVNLSGFKLPIFLDDFFLNMRGTYIVLGMMTIGIVISAINNLKFDFKFITVIFFSKFVIWPIITLSIITIDFRYINYLNDQIYHVLLLTSIVPLATNSVVIAILFKTYPEKTASAVLLSTVFDLIFLPLMISNLMYSYV